MKSIKHKLFISYTITIFSILLLLSAVSIYFFKLNKEIKGMELIDSTYVKIEDLIYDKKNLNISELDKYLDFSNQFLIIFKNDQLIFSNQSRFKTLRILDKIQYEDEEKYEEFYDDGYIEIENYIFSLNVFEYKKEHYEIYLGLDEVYLEESLDDVYMIIVFLNIFIFLILTLLAYILINKTINPLKLILEELKSLEDSRDLSKRLKHIKTNDEFEQLINSLNKMLNNIENSVENIKQFSSDASHELRTPLTVIQGEIELIKNKDISKEQIKEVLLKVDNQQKKLQDIIKNFLLLSRLDKEALKQSKSSLDEVIFQAIEVNLDSLEKKSLELQLDIDENLEVFFEQKYLNIVINNLLSNAIKYTQEGYIKLKAKKEDKSIYFEIEDSGIGIKQQNLDKIFERFYRDDKVRTSSKDGIGLGLAIVKKICERFESKLEVKSQINKGSTFKVYFR